MISQLAARYLYKEINRSNDWQKAKKVAEEMIEEYEDSGEELPIELRAFKKLQEYDEEIRTAIKITLILRYLYGDHKIMIKDQCVETVELKRPDVNYLEVEDNSVKIDYTGFAEFIAKKYAVLHFNGVFYLWDGSRYIDYDKAIDAIIYRHLIDMGFPRNKRATIYVAEIKRQLQYICTVNEYPFNRHNGKILIPVRNGVIWWNDGEIEFLPNSPFFGFTYCLNVEYKPGQKHEKIRSFLEKLVNQEDLEILYEIPAACIVRTRFPYVYFLYGTGSNGKSTYLNLITDLLGQENVSNVSLQDLSNTTTARFRIASLIGKLANIFPDLPSTSLQDSGIFKALTGDDAITVEKKFKDPFSFRNTARLIFSANAFPRVRDDSDAFWRRWIIVKFPNKFKNDPKFLDNLLTEEEKSAFLDEILKRLPRILECRPTINLDARSEWIRSIDSVRAFLEDCTVEDKDSYVVKEDLYNAYVEYCNEQGYEALSQNAFCRRLSAMYPTVRPKVGNSRKRAYRGIRLKTSFDSFKPQTSTERLITMLDQLEGDNGKDQSVEYVKIKLIQLPIGTDKVEFVGVDEKNYCLKLDEVAEVPVENARPLLERGYAIRIS